jgi:hypothetical protein
VLDVVAETLGKIARRSAGHSLKPMTSFVTKCIAQIIEIANGVGDDEKQKIKNGLAAGRALLFTRPHLLAELKDRLTISAAASSAEARRVLAEVRARL